MKTLDKTIIVMTLVVIVASGSPLIAHLISGQGKDGAKQPAVAPTIRTLAPNQTFSEIEGMKIGYPAHWTANLVSGNSPDIKQLSAVFEAPNTITKTLSDGGEQVLSGAKITVYKNSFSNMKSIEEFKQSGSFVWKYATNKHERTINDIQVVEFDMSYEHPSQHYAVFYVDSVEYMMAIDAEAFKQMEHKSAFENMIKNMEFAKK